MKPTVILDINGVLLKKFYNSEDKSYMASIPHTCRKIDRFTYFIRDDVESFLHELFSKYDIAIYSSSTKPTVVTCLKLVMTKEQQQRLLFILDRRFTLSDPEGPEAHSTIKSLEYVCISQGLQLNQVIIIDDDACKVRTISDKNKIVLKSDQITESNFYDFILERLEEQLSR